MVGFRSGKGNPTGKAALSSYDGGQLQTFAPTKYGWRERRRKVGTKQVVSVLSGSFPIYWRLDGKITGVKLDPATIRGDVMAVLNGPLYWAEKKRVVIDMLTRDLRYGKGQGRIGLTADQVRAIRNWAKALRAIRAKSKGVGLLH